MPIGFTDAGLRSLTKLDRLEVLRVNTFDGSPLTDESLKALCQIHSLKELDVAGQGFTNAGVGMLAGLTNLETLSIGKPGLDNETLKRLTGLPKLRQLSWMFWSDVTMSGLKTLNELAGLESLQAELVHQDDKGLDLSGLRNLKDLTIQVFFKTTRVGDEFVYTCDAFHDNDLACLSGLTGLESLRLNGRGIKDEGLKHLASLTRLKYLTIGGGPGLTDAGLRHLANLHRLDDLSIGDSRITEDGLAYLYPLKTLHLLRIATTAPISRQAIVRLSSQLPHLQTLEFSQPQPTRIKVPPRSKTRGS